MRILQVIPFFTPARGGSVAASYNFSKELVKRGHDVTIITSNYEYDKNYAKFIENKGVRVISFKCIFNLYLYLYTPNMKKWVTNNLRSFDIVHLHNFRSYQNNLIYNYSIKDNVPYILQAHGSIPYLGNPIKISLKYMYDMLFGRRLLKGAVKAIALNEIEANQYQNMGVKKEKIEIIPNGIDLKEYINLPPKGSFKKKYNISLNTKLMLYLGRINKIKGIDILVKAFPKIKERVNGVKLVIVGPDNGFLKYVQSLIKELKLYDNIILTGPLYGNDKLEAYVDADIFVLPSRYETFPTTVLEAMACGLPVILTENCGVADYFKDKIGLVIKSEINQLIEALSEILIDEVKQNVYRENCKILIEQFNISILIKNLIKLYTEVISE